jgi:hypothetical protein
MSWYVWLGSVGSLFVGVWLSARPTAGCGVVGYLMADGNRLGSEEPLVVAGGASFAATRAGCRCSAGELLGAGSAVWVALARRCVIAAAELISTLAAPPRSAARASRVGSQMPRLRSACSACPGGGCWMGRGGRAIVLCGR